MGCEGSAYTEHQRAVLAKKREDQRRLLLLSRLVQCDVSSLRGLLSIAVARKGTVNELPHYSQLLMVSTALGSARLFPHLTSTYIYM